MTPKRAQALLARSVIPAAYSGVRAWAEVSGADKIVSHYLELACADPGYLGHRLSVLLAFHEAWPLYKNGPQQTLYLDRLTEFILACGFTISADVSETPVVTWDAALSAALERPGFFGHNLICLAWVGRNKHILSVTQFNRALAWVIGTASTVSAEEEDNIYVQPVALNEISETSLESTVSGLLGRGIQNIHLLTLADAIAWLWRESNNHARTHLAAVAQQLWQKEKK
ncbi:MAG: hypothetical protein HY066_13120 [Betaproteobacteria bacterium]|nr:hypothetical protein [Betaproteobacteria bacterium]